MYDQSDKKKLHKQLKSVYKIESKERKKKTAFTKLLKHMAEYTEESGAVIFDPLKDKVKTYLKLIKKAEAIKNPQECFNFAIGEKSKTIVRSYISL